MRRDANPGSAGSPGGVRPARKRLLFPAVVGAAILLGFLLAGWYFTSAHFQEAVRSKVVAELERVTGGRVELHNLKWDLSTLQVEARDLTIHGREAPSAVPYFHADRVLLQLRIVSILRDQLAYRYLLVDHPVIHLITYADGSTNQPEPKVKRGITQANVDRLFHLAVQRVELRNGELLLNDQRLPLDLTADDVSASMDYLLPARRYEGRLHIGKLDTTLQDMRPFASSTDVEFTLWPRSAEVRSLTWTSGKSHFTAHGHLDNFSQPTITVSYQGSMDVAEMGAIARRRELRSGTAAFDGRASYVGGRYEATGRLNSQDLDVRSASARLHNGNIAGDYLLTNDRFSLSRISGHAYGGTISGDVEVHRWTIPGIRSATGHPRPLAHEQRGVVHLRIEGASVQALTNSFSSRSIPLDQLKLSGSTSGSIDATWRGSPSNAEAKLDFTAAPPRQIVPGWLPVQGQLQATYKATTQALQISRLYASTPAGAVHAEGNLGSSSAAVRLNLTTSNLSELQPIIAAFQGPTRIPVILHGKASLVGTMAGNPSAPSFTGHLQVADFDTVLAPVQRTKTSVPPAGTRRIHWDLLSTDLQLSPSNLVAHRGVLRRGNAEADFDGSTALKRFRAMPTSPLSARVQVRNADIADFAALLGYSYPGTGRLNLSLRAAGTWQQPNGDGTIQIGNASFRGQTIDAFTANLHLAGSEARFDNLQLAQGAARVAGAAAYDWRTTQFRFNLQGSDFDLGKFRILNSSRLTVLGKADFSAQGSGTPQVPSINADVLLRKLVFDGEPKGDFVITAVTQGANTHIAGRSKFTGGQLRLDGDVGLHGDLPAQLTATFSQLDVDPLLHAYLRGRLTGHSSTGGTLTIRGPLLSPRDLDIRGNLDSLSADIENLKLRNNGPVQFEVTQRTLTLQRFHLVGDGTDFEATGNAQIAQPRTLNLRANGSLNLKIIQTLNPDYMSSGVVSLALRVGGTLASPDLRGRLQIANGTLAYIDLPSGLSNINGTLVFNQDRLRVQSLTAQTGGGLLNLGGFITYNRNLNFDLSAQGQDIRLRYPPGMSTTANLDLHLAGSPKNSTLSGDILVTRFQFARNFDVASYLARAKTPGPLPNASSPLNNLKLDVHVTTTPELDVQTAIARVSGDADLRLRGSAAKPVVLGRVDIARGDVNFSGTRYHLERGDISFSNPVRIEPVLDLEASARVRDYDITLGFHGQIDKLNATYSSEPPLPTADIIALLAMGRTREESAVLQQQDTMYSRTASNAILSEALNDTTSNRLEKIFGVGRVKIDPEAGAAENTSSGTRVTIEQQFSNNLTLTYITNVSQASQQIIQAEYYVTRNISVIAMRDQNGVVSFDISIRRRKK